jgi:hypothetical protein
MDKILLENRMLTKREELRSFFKDHYTLSGVANELGCTFENIRQKIKRYGLSKDWHSHKNLIINKNKISPIACVYCLYFTSNNKYYGATKNLRKRIHQHLSCLKDNTHHNRLLQEDFILYKLENLKYEILKIVPEDQLLLEETKLIESDSNCYNKMISKSYKEKFKKKQKDYVKKRSVLKKNKSQYKYVTWSYVGQKWMAQPVVNKKQTVIGYFKTEEEAKVAIDNYIKLNEIK